MYQVLFVLVCVVDRVLLWVKILRGVSKMPNYCTCGKRLRKDATCNGKRCPQYRMSQRGKRFKVSHDVSQQVGQAGQAARPQHQEALQVGHEVGQQVAPAEQAHKPHGERGLQRQASRTATKTDLLLDKMYGDLARVSCIIDEAIALHCLGTAVQVAKRFKLDEDWACALWSYGFCLHKVDDAKVPDIFKCSPSKLCHIVSLVGSDGLCQQA
jgi:hypothetical protein